MGRKILVQKEIRKGETGWPGGILALRYAATVGGFAPYPQAECLLLGPKYAKPPLLTNFIFHDQYSEKADELTLIGPMNGCY